MFLKVQSNLNNYRGIIGKIQSMYEEDRQNSMQNILKMSQKGKININYCQVHCMLGTMDHNSHILMRLHLHKNQLGRQNSIKDRQNYKKNLLSTISSCLGYCRLNIKYLGSSDKLKKNQDMQLVDKKKDIGNYILTLIVGMLCNM